MLEEFANGIIEFLTGLNLLGEVVSGLIIAAVVSVLGLSALLLRSARYRAFWRFGRGEGIVRLIIGSLGEHAHPKGYRYQSVTIADAQSASLVSASIFAGYRLKKDVRCLPAPEFSSDYWREQIVLIGGRTRNKATDEYFTWLESKFDLPFVIHDLDDTVDRCLKSNTGTAYHADFEDSGALKKDYALITVGPDIRDKKDRTVISIYGLHAIGTIGGAEFVFGVVRRGRMKAILRAMGRRFRLPERYQILVEVQHLTNDVTVSLVAAKAF